MSNSVLLGGWVDGFKARIAGNVEVVNCSIGASPASMFGTWCNETCSNYDYIILDPVVNDEKIQHLVGNFEFFRTLMFEILSTFASYSNLVVLGFANERFEHADSNIYKFYRKLTLELGGCFESAIDFARTCDPPRFKDPGHMTLSISFRFGEYLADRLLSLQFDRRVAASYAGNFTVIETDQFGDFPSELRSSRLLTDRFALLRPTDTIQINQEACLIGIQIDAAITNGFVLLQGKSGERCLALRFNLTDRPVISRFIPVTGGFHVQCLTIKDQSEDFVSAMFEPKIPATGETLVAISRLLFWKMPERLATIASGLPT